MIETISHRRRASFGKKRLLLGRQPVVCLHRLRRFFLESGAGLPARVRLLARYAQASTQAGIAIAFQTVAIMGFLLLETVMLL